MAAGVVVKADSKWKQLYNLPPGVDFVICIGGRGGKKTYEVSKFAAYSAAIRKKRVAVMRDEKVTIRESILNEIFLRYDTANQHGHFNGVYDKIETGLRDMNSGQMLVFTKGFRASSNEKKSHLKGVSDVDIALIEEAEDIRSFTTFNTFKDGVRTKDRLIIVILNTPDIQHWIITRYFTVIPVTREDVPELKHIQDTDLDGYWKLIPKTIPGFLCIQSSYLDNEFLSEGVLRDYNAYGDINSPTYDLHYYLTAIKGFASSGRKGQILKKVKPITLKEYMAIEAKEYYGQDFGTASPAGLVGTKFVNNKSYCRELNYKPLDALGIGKLYCRLGFNPMSDLIMADSAEARSITLLRDGWELSELSEQDAIDYPQLLKGFYVRGAMKGPGSIRAGISAMTSMELFAVEESTNLWTEINNYIYEQNKEGEYTNDPEDNYNHLIDPWRYLIQGRGRAF